MNQAKGLQTTQIVGMGIALLAALPAVGQAQGRDKLGPLKTLAGFLSVGGYFPTDSATRRAIGDAKFYGDSAFYVRPKRYGRALLTGGVELMGASDHFLPFSGGNEFTLTGASFRVTTNRIVGQPRPYVSGGLFAGHLRSERLGFDRTDFTPSAAVGVEYPFARYFTLYANYRVATDIHGYNPNGFSVGLRLF